MPSRGDLTIDHEYGTNRYAAGSEPFASFINSGFEERVQK